MSLPLACRLNLRDQPPPLTWMRVFLPNMPLIFSHQKHNGSTAMPDTTQALIDQLAQLITEGLNLDINPKEIDADAPLFGQGLGLDSIDILEIAMLISKRYGFALRSDDTDNTRIFSSLRHLATHIAAHRST